jgi:hypothetical protein
MLQTFRLLLLVGFLAAACTPKPAPAPPAYKENPY